MNPNLGILFIVTKKFEAMKQFFVDLGLKVEEKGFEQVTPLLNRGRGCVVFLESSLISLEESTDVPPSGPLYLQIEGIDEARVPEMKGKYSIEHSPPGLYDADSYWIEPPDGGLVRVSPGNICQPAEHDYEECSFSFDADRSLCQPEPSCRVLSLTA